MATVALGLVGSAIGGAVGGPAGAKLGWAAGTLLGGALFPPKVADQEHGRLDDLKVTGSGYQVPIPIVFGCMRVGSNIIWATDLVQHVTRRRQGGKGTRPPTVKEYTYSVDMLVSLCEGPIGQVKRIWAEDTLIYDITRLPPLTPDFITIFLGTEDQQPWSIIEAALGVGNVPAYRGQCCVGFNDWDLTPYGGRIPAITAEVCPTFGPGDAAGLLLWLEGDAITALSEGDPVSSWPDQSDLGNDATSAGSARPTWHDNVKNGHAIVRGTSTTGMDVAGLTSPVSNYTIYAVVNPTNVAGGNQDWLLRENSLSGQIRLHLSLGSGDGSVGYHDGTDHNIAAGTNGWQMLTWHLDGDLNAGTVYRNGASLGAGTYTKRAMSGPGFMADDSTPGANTSFVGDVAAFLLYEGLHSGVQRGLVWDYLNTKYAIY